MAVAPAVAVEAAFAAAAAGGGPPPASPSGASIAGRMVWRQSPRTNGLLSRSIGSNASYATLDMDRDGLASRSASLAIRDATSSSSFGLGCRGSGAAGPSARWIGGGWSIAWPVRIRGGGGSAKGSFDAPGWCAVKLYSSRGGGSSPALAPPPEAATPEAATPGDRPAVPPLPPLPPLPATAPALPGEPPRCSAAPRRCPAGRRARSCRRRPPPPPRRRRRRRTR